MRIQKGRSVEERKERSLRCGWKAGENLIGTDGARDGQRVGWEQKLGLKRCEWH